MKMLKDSLLEWQKHYGTELVCEKVLFKIRWPNGFICLRLVDTSDQRGHLFQFYRFGQTR
jgi:hypothetical protein